MNQNVSGHDPEPPNLTNPRRVKKLTKFFGEDPPLMRLFLKNLGYEVRDILCELSSTIDGMILNPFCFVFSRNMPTYSRLSESA